ncbi:hypothetical protein FA15DRAFT_641937 [Coprinopsis marcescibilis]|uniref:RRM domain-containing protein n=1 Tax=Coprinopsis marcescibilis TaxID=230819 RepID=A0A5C3KT99_COPMA|nr:hypothetical protein FA15DRAFT_641937 [Coprinopsis marcescibilis]
MASNLGKRKDREEVAGTDGAHGSTLFISNLPYTATSVDLQTLFSDIAPVRTAFVVTEQGTGVSKGVGYVSFAIKEDAESCLAKINEEGLDIAGRALRVQWAGKKPTMKETKEKEARGDVEKKPKPAQAKTYVKTAHDPLAIRTVIVTGLPSPLDSQTLWKKIRKCAGAEKLIYPAKLANDEEDPTTAHVIFVKPSNASEAVTKLHAHVYKGSLLSVTLKKRLENLSKPAAKKTAGDAPAGKAAPSRASRLIVRNLPFNATENDLRALFLPHGPVHSITMPLVEEEQGDKTVTRNKGFAFVWMLSKKDAETALGACNGKAIRAGMAEELVSNKQKRKKQMRLEKKAKLQNQTSETQEKADEEEEQDAEMEVDETEEKQSEDKVDERIIAVDWALSKEKWKEELAKVEKPEDGDVEMDSGSESGSDSGSSSESEGGLGVHGEDSDSSPSDDDDDDDDLRDSDDEAPVKPELPAPEAGTTLFVRNVPYNATEDELRTLFRAFGPLRYARITLDPESGRSRGTGFACFWNREDADKVVEQSDILRSEMTGLSTAPKKNPFSLPSILTPDPSSSMARTLVLHGRTLDVVRAVTRDVASKLKEEGEKLREKQDKRSMYLLREGVIFPNSPEAAHIPPPELERRNNSYSQRKALLKSNPSLFISRTRLSVRQMPLYATERMLKRLAIHAVRAYEAEVKAGTRTALTTDEVTERSEDRLDEIIKEGEREQEGGEKASSKDSKKGKGRDTGVKQTKIIRQAERVDPVTGKGRSKGYGFLEMHQHADSLRVLRWANNNPAVAPLFEAWWKEELADILKREKKSETKDEDRIKRIKDEIELGTSTKKEGRGRLIVEFSIENVQVVQRRNQSYQERFSKDKTEPSSTRTPGAKDGMKKDKEHGSNPRPRKGDERPTKKRKSGKNEDDGVTEATSAPAKSDSKSTPQKSFNPVGSLIGRKRKAKKQGKK